MLALPLLSPCAAVDRKKYDGVFRSVLQSELSGPVSEAGSVSEAGARKLLQRSKIPEAELDKVLELADLDSDGRLTLDEFAIAMHLVTKRTVGEPLPEVLPTSMRPASAFLAPPLPSPPTRPRGVTVPTPSRTPGRAVAGAEATTSSPFSVESGSSSMAVSFAQDLAADVFSSADSSFLDAATLRADRAAERAARDALERASSSEIQLQAIELEGRVRELGDAKGALQAVSVHVVARHREAEELKLRIAATEQQRAAVAKEHEWCLRRLASLRGQCESYAGTLREKQHELHSATQELEALAREVTAVQTRMASQLDEAHALNRALITAREEVRALKQSQALLLQQAHVESKQVAPLHLELSQLTAEIGVLQQQIDATVANDLSADGRPAAPAVEYRELSRQPPVSFSPAMSVAQSAAGSPDTGLSHLSSAWSAQPPGPPAREQTFKAQPFLPPPFTPSVDPKRAWRGAEFGLVELSRPAERPAEPSSKPEKPTRRRQDKAPKQVGVLAFQSSNGHSSLHASAHHGALLPHRWASSPSSRPQATAARSAACRHWTVAARLRLRSTRFCRPPPHYRSHHR